MMNFLRRENGFTITEAIVAQVILILGALCIWNMVAAGTRFNAESEDRTIAANVGQLVVEEMMRPENLRILNIKMPGQEPYTDHRNLKQNLIE